MKRSAIRLLDQHPTNYTIIRDHAGIYAPLVINQDSYLIDGYRRFRLSAEDHLQVTVISTTNIFDVAYQLNYKTRNWDDVDCFFWSKWARALGVSCHQLPLSDFPEDLYRAPVSLLNDLAERRLNIRQVKVILEAPGTFQPFLQRLLTSSISLNTNETTSLVEMLMDLKNKFKLHRLEQVLELPELRKNLENYSLSPKDKGGALLKAMRALRYPYYHQKSEEFSFNWRELKFDKQFEVKRSLFIQRGILELSFQSRTHAEFEEKVKRLLDSLQSPAWRKIWDQ
jgi:hypothetical protein